MGWAIASEEEAAILKKSRNGIPQTLTLGISGSNGMIITQVKWIKDY